MMFQNEITISGHDALMFQGMMENPDSQAIAERDEFISDVEVDVLPNGEITVNCSCDFNDISQHNGICNVMVNTKKRSLYDTININVEASSKHSATITRLENNAWFDSRPTYALCEERCKYVSKENNKEKICISDTFAFAS